MKLNMIAQRLNLSESTVSRALNDYQDISADTKALVRKTAAELGYMPNMHARRLASGKADTIAYVMPRSDGQLNASFLGELMTGMAEALTARGWDLSVLVPRSVPREPCPLLASWKSPEVDRILFDRRRQNAWEFHIEGASAQMSSGSQLAEAVALPGHEGVGCMDDLVDMCPSMRAHSP